MSEKSPIAYAMMRENLRLSGQPTPDEPDFWANVIQAIRAGGMSYAEIARKAGTTRPSVSRWLRGHDKPKDHVAAKLCRLLADCVRGDVGDWRGLGEK